MVKKYCLFNPMLLRKKYSCCANLNRSTEAAVDIHKNQCDIASRMEIISLFDSSAIASYQQTYL